MDKKRRLPDGGQAAEEAKAATEAEFYANVREQAALLREIRDAMGKR